MNTMQVQRKSLFWHKKARPMLAQSKRSIKGQNVGEAETLMIDNPMFPAEKEQQMSEDSCRQSAAANPAAAAAALE